MAEFCFCGSIMIGGSCTNKNCIAKTKAGTTTKSKSTRSSKTADTKQLKKTVTRKSSKVKTYNLNDLNDNTQENAEENIN